MAIVKPSEMNFANKNFIMILTGLPGVGKTTLALSAPDPVLIDADQGIVRVRPEHRKDSSVCQTYEELLSDVKSFYGAYKTVVIDTGGALIDMLKDWAMRTEPSANKKNGGISQTGFGIVKSEFLRLSAELRRHFNVIFIFHVAKDRNGEDVYYDLICEGSAKNSVWQPADVGAYMYISNGERYLGFTPTANYTAKAAYGIEGIVKVPKLTSDQPNTLVTELFNTMRSTLEAENAQGEKEQEMYETAMAQGREIIAAVDDGASATDASKVLKNLPHALTSQKELSALLKQRVAELGLVWSKSARAYVAEEGEQ